MEPLLQDIMESLHSFQDPARVSFAARSFPTAMQVIGVTVPNERLILKEIKSQIKGFSRREKIDLALRLVETGIFECQHLAYLLLEKDKKALAALSREDLHKLEQNQDNWVSVDCFSSYILGVCWREGKVSTAEIRSRQESDDVWKRRSALVATIALNQKARGGKGDTATTLEICKAAVGDHEDMVIKALSWALRELCSTDSAAVIQFLETWQDQLHPKVLREVKSKLHKGTKI